MKLLNSERVVHRVPGVALLHGDCRHMTELADASVDLVITDPPFNVSLSHGRRTFDYGEGVEADCIGPEEYGRWTGEWIAECLRVLKPGGQLYAIMSLKMMPWWMPQVRERNWHILAWAKTNAFFHRHKTYLRAWEPILWVVKGDTPTTLHRTFKFADDRDWFIGPNATGESNNVLNRLKKRHPTPRPDWVCEHIILRASSRGMVVLDPMMGCGTAGRVARRLGRSFVGYDINREYVDLARQMLMQGGMEMGPVVENVGSRRQLELLELWGGAGLHRRESDNGGDGPEGAGGEVQGHGLQPAGADAPEQRWDERDHALRDLPDSGAGEGG